MKDCAPQTAVCEAPVCEGFSACWGLSEVKKTSFILNLRSTLYFSEQEVASASTLVADAGDCREAFIRVGLPGADSSRPRLSGANSKHGRRGQAPW